MRDCHEALFRHAHFHPAGRRERGFECFLLISDRLLFRRLHVLGGAARDEGRRRGKWKQGEVEGRADKGGGGGGGVNA